MKLVSLQSGWKTYAVVAAGIALGVIQGLDANGVTHFAVPTWVDWVLGFLGAGTLRHGLQTQTATVIESVLSAITTDDTAPPTLATGKTVVLPNGNTLTVGKPSPVDTTADELMKAKLPGQ